MERDKRALDRSIRDPLSTITIPGTTVTTDAGANLTNPDITLTTKYQVQEVIINKNIKNFSAAEQTPIGFNTALFDAIGPLCATPYLRHNLLKKTKKKLFHRSI